MSLDRNHSVIIHSFQIDVLKDIECALEVFIPVPIIFYLKVYFQDQPECNSIHLDFNSDWYQCPSWGRFYPPHPTIASLGWKLGSGWSSMLIYIHWLQTTNRSLTFLPRTYLFLSILYKDQTQEGHEYYFPLSFLNCSVALSGSSRATMPLCSAFPFAACLV